MIVPDRQQRQHARSTSVRCTARCGRRMLCQRSTALLTRTASSQARQQHARGRPPVLWDGRQDLAAAPAQRLRRSQAQASSACCSPHSTAADRAAPAQPAPQRSAARAAPSRSVRVQAAAPRPAAARARRAATSASNASSASSSAWRCWPHPAPRAGPAPPPPAAAAVPASESARRRATCRAAATSAAWASHIGLGMAAFGALAQPPGARPGAPPPRFGASSSRSRRSRRRLDLGTAVQHMPLIALERQLGRDVAAGGLQRPRRHPRPPDPSAGRASCRLHSTSVQLSVSTGSGPSLAQTAPLWTSTTLR